MPLGEYISEVIEILTMQPNATEILVKRVEPLRFAAAGGAEHYKEVFDGLNSMF
jgi:uncharacterized oxidoreductase